MFESMTGGQTQWQILLLESSTSRSPGEWKENNKST